MIIVDSSIWIDHFQSANPRLIEALLSQEVLQHPLITVELALGSIPRRQSTIADLNRLPQVKVVPPAELLAFIDRQSLHGTGIGSVDANLLASALLEADTRLWTRDRRLAAQAERLLLAYQP